MMRWVTGQLAEYLIQLGRCSVNLSLPALHIWVLAERGDSVDNLYTGLGQALDELLCLVCAPPETDYERDLCVRFCAEVRELRLTADGRKQAPSWLIALSTDSTLDRAALGRIAETIADREHSP